MGGEATSKKSLWRTLGDESGSPQGVASGGAEGGGGVGKSDRGAEAVIRGPGGEEI